MRGPYRLLRGQLQDLYVRSFLPIEAINCGSLCGVLFTHLCNQLLDLYVRSFPPIEVINCWISKRGPCLPLIWSIIRSLWMVVVVQWGDQLLNLYLRSLPPIEAINLVEYLRGSLHRGNKNCWILKMDPHHPYRQPQ